MFKEIYKLGELTLMKKHKESQFEKHDLIDLFWECTMTCNAKCKHCWSSAEWKKYDWELTTEEIKKAFKQIASDMDASKILINVTGGEPLLRQDLCEVMEYATNDLWFRWGMTTNWTLLTKENIEKLKKANMETVSISVDWLEETHDKFRGMKGSYTLILNNIKNLKEAGFIKHLQVTTTFHKENINELEGLYEVMLNLWLTSWRLLSMDPIWRASENSELLLDKDELKKILDFILLKNKEKKLQLSYWCASFLWLDYEKDARWYYFFCRAWINVASILYNWDLFVCPSVPRVKNLIQWNIKIDNFADIWNNKYKEFRNKNRTSCDNCKKCDSWNYCLWGSFHTWDFDKNIQKRCVYEILKD